MKEFRNELRHQGVLTLDGLRWSDGYAWCELRPTYDVTSGSLNIRYLWASKCRHGYGTALLSKITRAADKLGRTLYLEAQPFSKPEHGGAWCFDKRRHGGMTETQLMAWYGRHGFEKVGGKVMMRKALAPADTPSEHPSAKQTVARPSAIAS